MKNCIKGLIAALLAVTMTFLCCSCFDTANTTETMDDNPIKLTKKYDGKEVSFLPPPVSSYLKAETEKEQAEILKQNEFSACYGLNAEFYWESDEAEEFIVHFSKNSDFSEETVARSFSTSLEDFGVLSELLPGEKYYWKVTDAAGEKTSATDSFVYKDEAVRIIVADGATNIRDIGGWKTTGGKTVAYGKIFRGGRLNDIKANGKKTFNQRLKIKTELDLRKDSDDGGQKECAFGENVAYKKLSLGQYGYVIPSFKEDKPYFRRYDGYSCETIGKIFALFADEENYPIYYHCNAGADRTGTLTFLLNGFLGVPYESLVKDFELTSFSSYGKRWRGEISDERFINGVMQDDNLNYVAFGELYELIMTNYAKDGESLPAAIEKYLKNECGVSDSQLKKIRHILIGD